MSMAKFTQVVSVVRAQHALPHLQACERTVPAGWLLLVHLTLVWPCSSGSPPFLMPFLWAYTGPYFSTTGVSARLSLSGDV